MSFIKRLLCPWKRKNARDYIAIRSVIATIVPHERSLFNVRWHLPRNSLLIRTLWLILMSYIQMILFYFFRRNIQYFKVIWKFLPIAHYWKFSHLYVIPFFSISENEILMIVFVWLNGFFFDDDNHDRWWWWPFMKSQNIPALNFP